MHGASHHSAPFWWYGLLLPYNALRTMLLAPCLLLAPARRRGVTAALATALAMLVLLSLIPGTRSHYPVPALPFVALAPAKAAAAAARGANRRWLLTTASPAGRRGAHP